MPPATDPDVLRRSVRPGVNRLELFAPHRSFAFRDHGVPRDLTHPLFAPFVVGKYAWASGRSTKSLIFLKIVESEDRQATPPFPTSVLRFARFAQFTHKATNAPTACQTAGRAACAGESARTIEARGRELLCLPPYSPDLNPIEEAFPKIEAMIWRRAGAAPARRSWRLWTGLSPPPPRQTPGISSATAATVCRANISDARCMPVACRARKPPT